MNSSVIPVGATYCLPMGCFRVVSWKLQRLVSVSAQKVSCTSLLLGRERGRVEGGGSCSL